MAKKSEIGYREILSSIRQKNFAPVYILMGEEPYYLDMLSKALETNVIEDETTREFNSVVFYGADSNIEKVVASAQQFPAMGGLQLVMLKEAQSMPQAKKSLDKLEGYLKHPNRTTVLVIVFKDDSLPATSKLIKAAAKGGAIVYNSEKLRDYQLPSAVKDYCQSRGFRIEDKAATLLSEYIGSPLSKLFGEIDKLCVAVPKEARRITAADIELNIGISKDYNNFELVKALSRRDYGTAMGIVTYFKSNPKQNPVVITTATLFNFYVRLVLALFSPDRSDNGLMKELEVKNVWALTDVKSGMENYNASQAVEAIHILRDFDCKTKGIGSTQNEYELLRELIFRLVTL